MFLTFTYVGGKGGMFKGVVRLSGKGQPITMVQLAPTLLKNSQQLELRRQEWLVVNKLTPEIRTQ